MDCRSVIHSLSDYVDGHLAQPDAQWIESHLRRCPPCQTIKADLQEIRSAARELPLHAPPRALWARIQQEIELKEQPPARRAAATQRGWWQRLGEKRFTFTLPQLAGAGALAASLLVFTAVRSNLSVSTQSLQPTKGGGAVSLVAPNSQAVQAMQSRIEERLNRLNTRKAAWDPQMKQVFEEHLKRIDFSLANTRQTLEANPDPDQQQMLLDLYKEKLQVLDDFDKLR